MTRDIEFLMEVIRWCLYIAAVCTTAVPVIFAFATWYRSLLGRAFMLQAVAFAAVIDLTALFQLWTPTSVAFIVITNMFVFLLVAVATALLAAMIWRLNHQKGRKNGRIDSEEPTADEQAV